MLGAERAGLRTWRGKKALNRVDWLEYSIWLMYQVPYQGVQVVLLLGSNRKGCFPCPHS